MLKLISYLCFFQFLFFGVSSAQVKLYFNNINTMDMIKPLDKLSFSTQIDRDFSVKSIEDYILKNQNLFIKDHKKDSLKIKLERISTYKNRTTIRYKQVLNGARQIPIIGANIIASVNNGGELESLNSSLISIPHTPKIYSLTFENYNQNQKEASKELKKLFKAVLEFESPKFNSWVEKTTRTNKISLSDERNNPYPGTPVEFIKESENNLEYFLKSLSKISIMRLFITFSKEEKINLIAQKYPDGSHEILWRVTSPFDIPIEVDIDASKKSFVIIRVLSLIKYFKTDVYKASRLFPASMGTLKVSASSSDEIDFFNNQNFDPSIPQPQSQSASQNTPQSWDYAAFNFLRIKEFYENKYFINSYNSNGIDINAIVDIKLNVLKENAAWLGAGYNIFLLGSGGKILNNFEIAIDVLAHEYTHAIDEFNAKLLNFGEPGGIGEHISDIMGIAAEKEITGSLNFQVGEATLSSKVKSMGYTSVRDLENPELSISKQPKTMTELYLLGYSKDCKPTEENDKCYVHASNGVLNYAIAQSMKKIGLEYFDSIIELIFATFTLRIRSDSDFNDYYVQLTNECEEKSGLLPGIDSNSCLIIKNEFEKAGIGPSEKQNPLENTNKETDDLIRETCELFKQYNMKLPDYCKKYY